MKQDNTFKIMIKYNHILYLFRVYQKFNKQNT